MPPPFSHTCSATRSTSLFTTHPTLLSVFSDLKMLCRSAWYNDSVCNWLPCVRMNTVFWLRKPPRSTESHGRGGTSIGL